MTMPSEAPRDPPEGDPFRGQLVQKWLLSKLSPETRTSYLGDIGIFFRFMDAHGIDIFSVGQTEMEQYREWLTRGEGNSFAPATINRRLTAVASFYRYAVRHTVGLIEVNPMDFVDMPRISKESTTTSLSRAEIALLRHAARDTSPRTYALVLLFLGTGLRVSEVSNSNIEHLETLGEQRVLNVTRKGGKRQRVAVPPVAARALDAYLDTRQSGPLFLTDGGKRMTRTHLAFLITACGYRARIPNRITPHSLRHTAATMALDAGATIRDLQVLMGHTDPNSTIRYDRARRDLNNGAARALADLLAEDDE